MIDQSERIQPEFPGDPLALSGIDSVEELIPAPQMIEATSDNRLTIVDDSKIVDLLSCEFSTSGSCVKGNACTYRHDKTKFSTSAVSRARSSTRVCKFWGSRGGCKKANRCSYSHADGNGLSHRVEKPYLTRLYEKSQERKNLKKKNIDENEAERQAKLAARKKRSTKMRMKTKNGQPVMKYQMENLLSQIKRNSQQE